MVQFLLTDHQSFAQDPSEYMLMKKEHGFTLIEILIVAAIIMILASLAVPALLHSKMASNETSAIGSLKVLTEAQTTFQAMSATDADTDGIGEYGSFAQLSNAIPAYIDDHLGSGQKSGYFFIITTTGVPDTDERLWEATAYPMAPGWTGNRTFYIDEGGVLRGTDNGGGPATRATANPAFGGNFPPVSQ